MSDLQAIRKEMHMVEPREVKSGDTAYFSPSELFATPDRKLWLSTRHDFSDKQSEYHCAKLELSDGGVDIDLGQCLQTSKHTMIDHGSNAKDPEYRLPVMHAQGWDETRAARALEAAKAYEQNQGLDKIP